MGRGKLGVIKASCADFLVTEMMRVGKRVSVLAVHSTTSIIVWKKVRLHSV
jgi:hypothetical protein